MVKTPLKGGPRKSRYNANTEIRESLTPLLLEHLRNLPTSRKVEYLLEQVLTKYVSDETDPAPVRRQRAIEKWLATEERNASTNMKLLLTHEDYHILPRVSFDSFVQKAREYVVDIIGETPPIEALIGSFSGGASTGRLRTESHPASKYLGLADTTSACLELFNLIYNEEEMPGWSAFRDQLSIRQVPGNVLFTVPKNTTIDRCACKEPEINMFIQKGIGNYFRSSLRKVGINLNDQSRNRMLARVGSIDGSLATLDLSSASDSITSVLVQLLLPETWFTILNGARSPVTIIDGHEHVNEMFSSMGNGFTFELESLLFYVLARTTAYFRGIRGVISVYGDDIICPTMLAEDLIWVLGYFGFETNKSKSFYTGSFRESCGGHYDNGDDITPFYLKAPVKNLTDLILLANKIRKWAVVSDSLCILDPTVYPLWNALKERVPSSLWGGHDYNDQLSLVTGDAPRKRLVPIVTKSDTGTGGYIHWLNTTMGTGHVQREAVITSSRSKTSTRYRLRPAISSITNKRHWFCEELA